jgi:ribosomal protein S18 acetylase RimI-like enzyme
MTAPNIPDLRDYLRAEDPESVRRLVREAGVFGIQDVEVAGELVEERLIKGPAGGYHFLLVDIDDRVAAYICYGPVPLTQSSWDIYWIVTDVRFRGCGLGGRLLHEAEQRIRLAGGLRIYIETSSRSDYGPAQRFYQGMGYERTAELVDFYGPGDNKLIYLKVLIDSGKGRLAA